MLFINNSNNRIADIQLLFKNGEKKKKRRGDGEGGRVGGRRHKATKKNKKGGNRSISKLNINQKAIPV